MSANVIDDMWSIVANTVAENSLQIAWATSFFLNRLVARTSGESYRQSALSAVIVSGIAAIDFTLRNKEYVATHAITYGAVTSSYVLSIMRDQIHIGQEDSFVRPLHDSALMLGVVPAALMSGVSVATIVQQGYVGQSIIPMVTSLINYKIHGSNVALISGAFSVIDEIAIHYNLTSCHYLSFAALSGGTVSYFIPNSYVVSSITIAVSAIAAPQEEWLLEQFFPVESIKNTHSILMEVSNHDAKYVDRMLETCLVITANIEFSSGILYMQSLAMVDRWIVLFREACDDKTKIGVFTNWVKKQLLFDLLSNAHGVFGDPINSFILAKIQSFIKEKLFANKIFKQNSLLLLTNNNYTVETYYNDLSTILNTHWGIYQNSVYYFPAIITLASLGNKILLVPLVAIADLAFTGGLVKLEEWIQQLSEEQTKVLATMGVVTKHDVENANLLIHAGAADYMIRRWKANILQSDQATLTTTVISNIRNSARQIYWDVAIWNGMPLGVVYLVSKGIIPTDGVIQAIFAVKESVGVILVKSKKRLELNTADLAIKRLQDFFVILNNQTDITNSLDIKHKENGHALIVNALTYVRGSGDSNITVTIPSLELIWGKKYVFTGGNGSGKSSFLLLLDLLLRRINDDSFLKVSGSIIYPVQELMLLMQKDYCPMHSDLFGWLIQPIISEHISGEEKLHYKEKILSLLQDLKFSSKNLTSLVEEFEIVKNNWCGELSGGQVKKIQLMQSVFIPESCPKILLLDETMGALDPESKQIVLDKLQAHCKESLIIMVYHYDHGSCVTNDGFFDENIHFENGVAFERLLCGESGNTHEIV